NWGWLSPLLSTSCYTRWVTTSTVQTFCLDLGSPALLRFLQASGHINSYGDGQECVPYIQPKG
ncbi:hypothetical protein B9T07_26115, partial [Limnospira fusiformis CCALA 023]